MTKTQDRQVYLDVAKGMGMLGVVASHCLVETSLGILSDWYGFFMLAVFMSIQGGGMRSVTGREGQAYPAGRWQEKDLYPWEFHMCATACCLFSRGYSWCGLSSIPSWYSCPTSIIQAHWWG